MIRRHLPARVLPAASRLILALTLFSGLVASLLALAAPAAAADVEITCDLGADVAQVALNINPAYAPVLDPDGDGIACNHGAADRAGDALAGRLGGTRDSFEAVYGEPLGEDPPYGLAYPINGGFVLAAYDDGRIVHLVLMTESGRTWTPEEAGDLLVLFLPGDSVTVGDGERTAEAAILYGFSAELAVQIDPDVYDAYGFAGGPGDFYTAFWLTAAGDVTAVEISLGSEYQQFTGSAGDRGGQDDRGNGGASTGEAGYLATLTAEIDTLTASVDSFYALLNSPNLGDQSSAAELDAILTTWVAAYENAQSLTPPPGYDEVHAAYLTFTQFLAEAALALYDNDVNAAAQRLLLAQGQAEILSDLLEAAAGADVLDRPSG